MWMQGKYYVRKTPASSLIFECLVQPVSISSRNWQQYDIRIPVIVISASDDAQTREHARELGAISFFRKPVDDQVLLDGIRWANSGITV